MDSAKTAGSVTDHGTYIIPFGRYVLLTIRSIPVAVIATYVLLVGLLLTLIIEPIVQTDPFDVTEVFVLVIMYLFVGSLLALQTWVTFVRPFRVMEYGTGLRVMSSDSGIEVHGPHSWRGYSRNGTSIRNVGQYVRLRPGPLFSADFIPHSILDVDQVQSTITGDGTVNWSNGSAPFRLASVPVVGIPSRRSYLRSVRVIAFCATALVIANLAIWYTATTMLDLSGLAVVATSAVSSIVTMSWTVPFMSRIAFPSKIGAVIREDGVLMTYNGCCSASPWHDYRRVTVDDHHIKLGVPFFSIRLVPSVPEETSHVDAAAALVPPDMLKDTRGLHQNLTTRLTLRSLWICAIVAIGWMFVAKYHPTVFASRGYVTWNLSMYASVAVDAFLAGVVFALVLSALCVIILRLSRSDQNQ